MQYSPPSHVNCSHGSSVIDNIDNIKIGREMSQYSEFTDKELAI